MSPREKAAKRSELSRRVGEEVRRQGLLQPGQRVAVACSGGADSVALLLLLDELKEPLGLRLLIAHLNHQLRGAEADADESFVRNLAEQRGLGFVCQRVDVAEHAKKHGMSVEEAGRESRLYFLGSLLASGKADVVAVAHTLDDQAETVVAQILRGTGVRGLGGIHPVLEIGVGAIVRPLLGIHRAQLRDYLSAREQPWREDLSNRDQRRLRNRIRMELLPLLGQQGVENLGRLAEQARIEESFWYAIIEERYCALVHLHGGGLCEIEAKSLLSPLPALAGLSEGNRKRAQRAVARRLVRRLCEAVRGDLRRITQDHVERVLRLAEEGQSGKRVVLPGLQVERQFDRLVFSNAKLGAKRAATPGVYRLEVAGPGVVRLPSGGALAFKLVGVEEVEKSYNWLQGAADASRASFPLVVRPWQAGDRYQPAGAAQEKKLKALFQQGRVPVAERRRTPVVLCQEEIVWVPRFGVAASYGLSPGSRTALVIEERTDA